jgi:hypothetical protein
VNCSAHPALRSAGRRNLVVANNAKIEKTNIKEVGLNSIGDKTVQNNLMGKSRYMDKKGWVDAQGRKVGETRPGTAGQC